MYTGRKAGAKKGAIEMSMETLILLVIGIVLLIVAYYIYSRGIDSVKSGVCDGLSAILAQFFEILQISGSSTVC